MVEEKDENLVKRYLHGDEKALEILIKRYLKAVYNFVYYYTKNASDAEDITQDVFIRVWKKIKKFDQRKNFKSWLFGIARNAAIDFIRQKKAVPFSSFETGEGQNYFTETVRDVASLPDEVMLKNDLTSFLAPAVDKLSADDQEIIQLRHDDDLTFREIAQKLQAPLNTVKSRYRRALIFLKKLLANFN